MPWNDQQSGGSGGDKGGGPWGSGPRKPWGQPPRQPQGPQQPDLEEMLRRFGERMRGSFGGGNGGGGTRGGMRAPGGFGWPLIAGVVIVGWLLTGVYVVNEGERAVVTRLGTFNRITDPGIHLQMPAPFESRRVENVTGQRVDEIGFLSGGQQGRGSDIPEESLMITGDRNIVEIHFRIVYNIANVRDFVFNVRDPELAARNVAESAMREVIGRRQLEPIITTDRAAVEQEAESLMQQVLNDYGSGINVLQVELLRAAAPPAVVEAFNDVVNAGQEAEAARNNAERETATIINQAQAYREQTIREATGDAQAFLSVYNEYRAAPRVTRDRIYLSTMERVLNNADTIILDQRGGAVPYLPLEGVRSSRPQAATQGGAR